MEERSKKGFVLKSKKRPLRDNIKPDQFRYILNKVSGNGYCDVCALLLFILLYITGLRASNLRFFTLRHPQELRDSGRTYIKLIKNGALRHPLVLSPDSLTLWRLNHPIIEILSHGKRKTDYLFTGLNKPGNEGYSFIIYAFLKYRAGCIQVRCQKRLLA